MTEHRVWIQIEQPKNHVEGHERAKRLDALLRRAYPSLDKFFKRTIIRWNEKECSYSLAVDTAGGYLLSFDGGFWFELPEVE